MSESEETKPAETATGPLPGFRRDSEAPHGLVTTFGAEGVLTLLGILIPILAHPPFGLGPLAFLALVPWLILLRYAPRWRALLFGMILIWGFFFGGLHWLANVDTAAWIAASLGSGGYFFIFVLFERLLLRRSRLPVWLHAPVLFCSVEYLRSVLFYTAFPWLLLGHTQIGWSWLIQVADIGGAYLVSFLVAFVGSALASVCFSWLEKGRASLRPLILAGTLLLLANIYGIVRLATLETVPGPRIGLVQPNIPMAFFPKAPGYRHPQPIPKPVVGARTAHGRPETTYPPMRSLDELAAGLAMNPRLPRECWITGRLDLSSPPAPSELEALVGDRPVFLLLGNGRGYFSPAAIAWFDLDSVQSLPPGVERNPKTKRPTGIVHGAAFHALRSAIPSETTVRIEYLTRLSRQIEPGSVDLMVWPESMLPYGLVNLPLDQQLPRTVIDLVKSRRAGLLFGAVHRDFESFACSACGHRWKQGDTMTCPACESRRIRPAGEYEPHNSAFYLGPDGRVGPRYDKRGLVPVSEFVPFKKTAPPVHRFFKSLVPPNFESFEHGRRDVLLNLDSGHQIAPIICFEISFAEQVRRLVDKGADVVVNVSNYAWFVDSAELDIGQTLGRFRAIETRRGICEAVNGGISSVYHPTGRLAAEVRDDEGNRKQIDGHLVEQVETTIGLTPYVLAGDAFAHLLLVLSLVGIVGGLTKWRRDEREDEENEENGEKGSAS